MDDVHAHGADADELAATKSALTEAARAVLIMLAKTEQRETQLHESFGKELSALRNEVAQVNGEVASIVRNAAAQIAVEAKQAVAPVAAEYNRAVSATSVQLGNASKTVWLWFASGAVLLLLALLVGWMVLGYYRHELADSKAQLQNYKDAVPVLQAFAASDATLCDGRLCVNTDDSARFGDKRQYRQARPRPQR
jgi:hypothetical protein